MPPEFKSESGRLKEVKSATAQVPTERHKLEANRYKDVLEEAENFCTYSWVGAIQR